MVMCPILMIIDERISPYFGKDVSKSRTISSSNLGVLMYPSPHSSQLY